MDNNQNNHVNGRFAVQERRRQVALLLAQSKTESEIASLLNVGQGTISRDIKALRELYLY
jgi:transposase